MLIQLFDLKSFLKYFSESLKEESVRIEENLEVSRQEQYLLSDQLRDYRIKEADLKKYTSKCHDLEKQIADYKHYMEKACDEFEKEKMNVYSSMEDVNNLKQQVCL